jgi:hypothetical protein
VRTSQANQKSMWQCFRVLRVKCQNASLNRRPSAYTCRGGGRGSVLTQYQSQWVIRLTWHTARNFTFYRRTAVCNNLQHYFGSGDTTNSQDRSQRYDIGKYQW